MHRVRRRPERVIGVHFFNSVPALPLVALVSSLATGEETRRTAEHFITRTLGKTAVNAPNRPGVHRQLPSDPLPSVRDLDTGVGFHGRRH
ncbi:3-hydroxyacyl-CoA dehydrogenase NAD-binding domain-containing protein [Streptomyces mirabilis]|uniref:3-hydroxyacyl-CoA dehydrogenase NAD-binding domain-containing protein n=1 Tax=Streptomyces mirabilis TaxID=68239 RepID=UPI0033F86B10